MKPSGIRLSVVLAICAAAVLAGCGSHHHSRSVRVDVDQAGMIIEPTTGEVIETLFVRPGSRVIWANPGPDTVELTLPSGWFKKDTVRIPPKGRAALEVLRRKPGEASYRVVCRDASGRITRERGGPKGPPRIKIGDEP